MHPGKLVAIISLPGCLLAFLHGGVSPLAAQTLSMRAARQSEPTAQAEYRIDPQQSTVNILVYSEGPLARFAHNHVMTSRSVGGSVSVDDETQDVDFELSLPVAQLIVDDPAARRAAGDDFPPNVTERDRAAARRDMLGPKVLDAENYPTITLQSVRASESSQSPQMTVRITIKGVSRERPVSASVQFQGTSLRAGGEFDILQTDFGIRPFSTAFGAIRIQDRLHVSFVVVADRT